MTLRSSNAPFETIIPPWPSTPRRDAGDGYYPSSTNWPNSGSIAVADAQKRRENSANTRPSEALTSDIRSWCSYWNRSCERAKRAWRSTLAVRLSSEFRSATSVRIQSSPPCKETFRLSDATELDEKVSVVIVDRFDDERLHPLVMA